jgi:hypothetical protein
MTIAYLRHDQQSRKRDLVSLGQWGIATGRRWVVHAVRAALAREDLRHA